MNAKPAVATRRLREPVRGSASAEWRGPVVVVRPATSVTGELGVGVAVSTGWLVEAASAFDSGAGAAGGAVGEEGLGLASGEGAGWAGCEGGGAGFAGGEAGGGWLGGFSPLEGGRPGVRSVSGQWQPGRSTHRGGAWRSGAGAGSGRASWSGHRPHGRRQSFGSWRAGHLP